MKYNILLLKLNMNISNQNICKKNDDFSKVGAKIYLFEKRSNKDNNIL